MYTECIIKILKNNRPCKFYKGILSRCFYAYKKDL